MQNCFDPLVLDVMPIHMIIPDNLIIIRFCINCSTVICSPTVEYLCSWEKPLVKPMAPGSILIISISITLILALFLLCLLLFTLHLYIKYTKKLFIISIRSHPRKWPWRDWQPLYRVGCEVLICLCRCVGLEGGLLLDWYLGSQKLREILTLYFTASPFPLQGKTNAVLKR